MVASMRKTSSMRAKMLRILFILLVAGGVPVLASQPIHAQEAEPKLLATNAKWDVYEWSTANGKVCYVAAEPLKWTASRENVNRGPIFFIVTFRPGENIKNEIRVEVGYPFSEGSTVSVKIGDSEFLLATEGQSAWMAQRANEDKLVEAMKAGVEMVVEGVSSRGTKTTDTYSLNGVTASLAEIDKSCN